MEEGKEYLECSLPELLAESVKVMQAEWDKMDRGEESYHWDIYFCDLQTNINICETSGLISSEQAWYLREKYLGLERN